MKIIHASKLKSVKNCFSARRIIDQVGLPTIYANDIAFGGREMDILYLLTATLDADIITGIPNNITVQPPGGSLIKFYGGFGMGRRVRKPCV